MDIYGFPLFQTSEAASCLRIDISEFASLMKALPELKLLLESLEDLKKLADALDKIPKNDLVTKSQLDELNKKIEKIPKNASQIITELDRLSNKVVRHSDMEKNNYSFLQFVGKINFVKGVHDQKTVTMLFIYFDDEGFIRIPIDVEVIKFYSTANLKDLEITNNKMKKFDLSKPFYIKETDLLNFMIKKEKVNTDENLGGYNHNKPYLLNTPIFFYMLVKFSVSEAESAPG